MDWVGVTIERCSKMKLGDYMRQHIFKPLGIEDMSMEPSENMKTRLTGIWQRGGDGKLSPGLYPLTRPLTVGSGRDIFHSGGAGLFGSVREFSSMYHSGIISFLPLFVSLGLQLIIVQQRY